MTHEKQEKCLYLVSEQGKWAIKEHLEPLNPIYNGVGWFIEEKHRHIVEPISKKAEMRLMDFPLSESFDSLRRRYKVGFFQEKAIKIHLAIDGLKATLNISSIDTEELINNENQRKDLEKISEGKELLKNIEEYDRLQSQIRRIENEEKIANLSDNKFDIQPYTLELLKKDLLETKEGFKTGYAALDDMVRIPNEAITLIGGRPSHGKTTFMLNLFLNLIKQYPNLHFYFFSYEETRQQIAVKIINILSGWLFEESKNIIQLEGYLRLDKTSLEMVEKGKQKYQELVKSGRLQIIGEPYHVLELSTIISSLKSKVPLGGVFIDYIQKIKNKQRFGTRQLELADTSNVILETAKKCSVPIILGAQLGRDKESKDKVKLDNLREAGDLEQDANLVLGIFNPAMNKAQEEQTQLTERKVILHVTPLKNRNGPVNKRVELDFDRPLLQINERKK